VELNGRRSRREQTHSGRNEGDQSRSFASRFLIHSTTSETLALSVAGNSFEASDNGDLGVVLEMEGGVEEVALF